MEAPTPRTTEKTDGPRVQQYSVFLPNKVGALAGIVTLLNEHGIHVLALNVQESADAAIVRFVTSDPEETRDLFGIHDIPYSSSELLIVELREGAAELPKLLVTLLMAEVNILGSYALLIRPRGSSALALQVEDNECASAVLLGHGFRLLSQADLSR